MDEPFLSPDPSVLRGKLDQLDPPLRVLLDRHHASPSGVRSAFLARCWPDDLPRRAATRLDLLPSESLDQARQRLGILWNPQWLLDAGHSASDANGVLLSSVHEPATCAGPVNWLPEVRLPRLDDKAPVDPATAVARARSRHGNAVLANEAKERRIVAGEVAVAALWMSEARSAGITTEEIDASLSQLPQSGAAARGARWNAGLAYYLQCSLPGWRVETQVNIRDVFGLHLRSDVVSRSADIVVVSPGGKIMAFVSAKFSWRSDRGTEAAQMVFLQRYRPDLPYVLATAEFPRALTEITSESIEDQAFHLCGEWVGAWSAAQSLSDPDVTLEDLDLLREAGRLAVPMGTLPGLDSLAGSLATAARYL